MAETELRLRGLHPVADIDLFHEAYDWRAKNRPGHLPFERWLEVGPEQSMLGLFNGEFIALYMVKQFAPGFYDLHFTSKRGVPRDYLVAGGIQITNWLLANGAIEVSALISARNRPLQRFLESCGYSLVGRPTFNDTLGAAQWLKYAAI